MHEKDNGNSFALTIICWAANAQYAYKIAKLKYNGGGIGTQIKHRYPT